MALKQWIQSPVEWGDWGTRFNAWMAVVADAVQFGRWTSSDDLSSVSYDLSTTGRIRRYIVTGSAGTPAYEEYVNGVRSYTENDEDIVWYEDDAGTAMLSMEKDTGQVTVHSVLNSALNPYSGWTDYGAPYEGWRWYKDANGIVTIQGLVRNSSGATKAAGSNVILLPTGVRPPQDNVFVQMGSPGAIRVDVLADGRIVNQSAIVNGGFLSLSGITFYAGW